MQTRGSKIKQIDLYVHYTEGKAQEMFEETFLDKIVKYLEDYTVELHITSSKLKKSKA